MHLPVLPAEVLQYLDPKPNENFIDCTIGEGNHTMAILERNGPEGKVLGIEADEEVIGNLKLKIENWKKRIILVCENFGNLKEIVKQTEFGQVDGILFDLGMSSWHLEESGRGFSFKKSEPLDMRYSLRNELWAEKILNCWLEVELEKILREYGEEKKARQIAKKIVAGRARKPIKTTDQLREIINKAGAAPRKTFQALRIAVNDELNNLKKALPQAWEILKPAGRLVVISFHSLEDRSVKNFFRSQSLIDLKVLTKKPVRPTLEEIKVNPRSRSAKLRAAVKL